MSPRNSNAIAPKTADAGMVRTHRALGHGYSFGERQPTVEPRGVALRKQWRDYWVPERTHASLMCAGVARRQPRFELSINYGRRDRKRIIRITFENN